MLTFHVKDMTCGHCVKAITGAVLALDANAKVQVDMAAHLVHINTGAHVDEMEGAIRAAGYDPTPIELGRQAQSAPESGCCCASRASVCR